MPNAAPKVRSGLLRGLAVSTAQRVSSMPKIPTVAESGVPGFDVSAWDVIAVPAGTPAPIVARLNEAVHEALADPQLSKQLDRARCRAVAEYAGGDGRLREVRDPALG